MKITGTVAVATNGNGRVMAVHADFGQQHPGGFSIQQAQEIRAKDAIAREVIRVLCADDIYRVIESSESRLLLHLLCEKKGWNATFSRLEIELPMGEP